MKIVLEITIIIRNIPNNPSKNAIKKKINKKTKNRFLVLGGMTRTSFFHCHVMLLPRAIRMTTTMANMLLRKNEGEKDLVYRCIQGDRKVVLRILA